MNSLPGAITTNNIVELYQQNKSIGEIAKVTGKGKRYIYECLKNAGKLRTKQEAAKLARQKFPREPRQASQETKDKIAQKLKEYWLTKKGTTNV